MTIKELEEESGISRANIRFYEKEGLLTPIRKANGYRDYSQKDLELLLKIKLLRRLYMSMDQIRALAAGTMRLDEALQKKIDELGQEQQNILNAQEVCRTMRADQAAFGNLQAEKYLEQLHQLALEHGIEEERPMASRIYAPHRRQLARMMDIVIAETFCALIMVIVFRCSLSELDKMNWMVLGIVGVVFALLTEPYLLHWFGTTPGKAIFGMRILMVDGSKLSVADAKDRLWEILVTQFTSGLRGFSLAGSAAARENYELQGLYWYGDGTVDLPWEKHNHSYTIKENSLFRAGLYLGVLGLCISLHFVSNYALRPDFHKGDLTPVQYAENVNRYIDFYEKGGYYSEWVMGSNGKWEKKHDFQQNVTVYLFSDSKPTNCVLKRDSSGHVTQASFSVVKSGKDEWISNWYLELKAALTGAFVCAQEDVGRFSKRPEKLVERMAEKPFESYHFIAEGLEITCEVTYTGYHVNGSMLIPTPNTKEKLFFELNFSVKKVEEE